MNYFQSNFIKNCLKITVKCTFLFSRFSKIYDFFQFQPYFKMNLYIFSNCTCVFVFKDEIGSFFNKKHPYPSNSPYPYLLELIFLRHPVDIWYITVAINTPGTLSTFLYDILVLMILYDIAWYCMIFLYDILIWYSTVAINIPGTLSTFLSIDWLIDWLIYDTAP